MGDAVFSKDSVQWCVTVPSIWDEDAKQEMKACMVNAGLVSAEAGGIEAMEAVLESEAAPFYCHWILREEREDVSVIAKDKILAADVGGLTVDILVQELVGNSQNYQVKKLTKSSGGLCGGTFIDESFMSIMYNKIGCLDYFLREDLPSYMTSLLKDWEEIKCAFGHETMSNGYTKQIKLHPRLAVKWEEYEKKRENALDNWSAVELTELDLKSFFDPVVGRILKLINDQLTLVSDVKEMFVVSGLAGSPYLMQRIRARFMGKVQHIVSPPNPGSAIVQGAVSLAPHPQAIVSRIAKKTYGTSVMKLFDPKLDPSELLRVTNGKKYCRSRFDVFVKKGTAVEVNNLTVAKGYVPHNRGQRQIMFDLYSSTEQEPRHTVASDTVTNEGGFVVDLPKKWSKDDMPEYEFSMYFGRSVIELKAERMITESGG